MPQSSLALDDGPATPLEERGAEFPAPSERATRPCEHCGALVVEASGAIVKLEPSLPAYVQIHTLKDGRPKVMRPANAFALHRCSQAA